MILYEMLKILIKSISPKLTTYVSGCMEVEEGWGSSLLYHLKEI